MRAVLTGTVAVALTSVSLFAAPAPAAPPTSATIEGELRIECPGCGSTSAAFVGAVVQASGAWAHGAVTASLTTTIPAPTGAACGSGESMSGAFFAGGNVVSTVAWTRTGTAIAGTLGTGERVTGSLVLTTPPTCAGPLVGRLLLQVSPRPGDAATSAGTAVVATYEDIRATRRAAHSGAGPTVTPILSEITTVQELRSWVDGIHIVAQTNFGGPWPSYEGAFADPNLWDCDAVMWPGTPTVTCTAVASSGIDWECGLMHAQAKSLSETDINDPNTVYHGVAAAYVSCDSDVLVTAQANQGNPVAQAQVQMGPVVTVTCKAQLDSNDGSPAIPPYHVICVDPPYPGD